MDSIGEPLFSLRRPNTWPPNDAVGFNPNNKPIPIPKEPWNQMLDDMARQVIQQDALNTRQHNMYSTGLVASFSDIRSDITSDIRSNVFDDSLSALKALDIGSHSNVNETSTRKAFSPTPGSGRNNVSNAYTPWTREDGMNPVNEYDPLFASFSSRQSFPRAVGEKYPRPLDTVCQGSRQHVSQGYNIGVKENMFMEANRRGHINPREPGRRSYREQGMSHGFPLEMHHQSQGYFLQEPRKIRARHEYPTQSSDRRISQMIDECLFQLKSLEEERKMTEKDLNILFPDKNISGNNNISIGRPCWPHKTDKLVTEMLKEHARVVTLISTMNALSCSDVLKRIDYSMVLWLNSIRKLEMIRQEETLSLMASSPTDMAEPLSLALLELCSTTRTARSGFWCVYVSVVSSKYEETKRMMQERKQSSLSSSCSSGFSSDQENKRNQVLVPPPSADPVALTPTGRPVIPVSLFPEK